MDKYIDKLDDLSGKMFGAGLGFSTMKMLPRMLFVPIINTAALSAYLIGYTAWLIAALFYPNQPRKANAWYGFSELKAQYQVSAFLGIIATILCLTLAPMAISASLYALSNTIWAIAEFHKMQVSPRNHEYSSTKQAAYFRYAAYITFASLISALAAVSVIAAPTLQLYVLPLSTLLSTALFVGAIYYWKETHYGNHNPDLPPPSAVASGSYGELSKKMPTLGVPKKPEPVATQESVAAVYHSDEEPDEELFCDEGPRATVC